MNKREKKLYMAAKFDEAADIIKKRGHTKGAFYRVDPKEGPVCALGAVCAAYSPSGSATYSPGCPYEDMVDAEKELTNVIGRGVSEFNDHPDTTRRQVLIKLRTAARRLRKAAGQ